MKKLLLVIVVLAAGYFGYRQFSSWQAGMRQSDDFSRPKTAAVIQTNINFAVNAAGEIGPAEQVSVRPEINGKIEVLPVDLGDLVKKDDLLFKLDDKELQQQYASSKTAIERSKLELQKAERDYKRALDLRAEKLISEELYENTKTTYELAKNSVDRAQKDLAILEERLTKTEVRAPFDCTVLTRPISVGQAVSGSGGFNSGTEVCSIADLTSMIINAHVNQADVPSLSVGQEVEVTVEAVTGLKVTGIVERIAPQATIKNNIKGFAARILLRNVDRRVRPGMTANIKIPVGSANNVLAVPIAAVFTELNKETGRQERYVFVVTTNAPPERRDVTVGLADFFSAEIKSGLQPGEVVALELPKEDLARQAKSGGGAKPASAQGANKPTPAVASQPAAGGSTNKPAPAAPTAAPAPAAPRASGGASTGGVSR